MRFETLSDGKVSVAPTTPFERAVIREDQAQAIMRLAIDDAMRTVWVNITGRRNSFGVNDTTDCYRTVGGEKYIGGPAACPQPGSQPTGPLECAAAGLAMTCTSAKSAPPKRSTLWLHWLPRRQS